MKTIEFLKLTGMILMGLILTTLVEAAENRINLTEKKSLTLTVNKPVIEFMAKAYSDHIDANDIVRLQKVAGKIDHLAVTFRDKDASDYVLTFKPMDENGLETWMFSAGYLKSAPEELSVSKDLITPPELSKRNFFKAKKKSVNLTIETPIIEYLARIYADQIEADDIMRLQKLCRQIDHITVTFRDEDAVDYVLKFRCLDDKGLENWMFNEGYLMGAPDPEPIALESWMLDPDYLE